MKGNSVIRSRVFFVFILTILFCCTPNFIIAQSLEETIQQLSEDAARQYVSPVVDGFGANLNSGWFQRAPKPIMSGFTFKVGLIAMGAFVDEAKRSFSTGGSYYFQEDEARQLAEMINGWNQIPPQVQNEIIQAIMNTELSVQISGPTAIGSINENVQVQTGDFVVNVGSESYSIPGQSVILGVTGLVDNPPMLPAMAPQATIGTVLGTQLILRYLPNLTISDEIGQMKYFGWGIQHNPEVWLMDPLPVDVSVGYYRQKLQIGSIFEETTNAFGIHVSKDFGNLLLGITPYAGFMFEGSKMKLKYKYELDSSLDPIDVNIEIDGQNKSRFIVGFGINLAMVNIIADYNFSDTNTGSVSLMLGL